LALTRSGAQRASRHRSALVAIVLALAALFAASPLSASAATAPWLDVERFSRYLVNCMRTGGWVRTDGTCKGYGSGRYSAYVPPLTRSAAISDLVTRPWAKYLARSAQCYHGSPGSRLLKAGFTSYLWAENIGCRDGYGTTRAAVLASHLYFQSEKFWNPQGGHWRNIKNKSSKCFGIGIWRYNGRTRLVQDFYAPCA
jgi:hypothetical protein